MAKSATAQNTELFQPGNEFETVKKFIEKKKEEGWNICSPPFPFEDISNGTYIPVVSGPIIMSIEGKGADAYTPDDKVYRLHARGLIKLAKEGGLKRYPEKSGFEYKPILDGKGNVLKTIIINRQIGSIMGPDGLPKEWAGYYDFDPDVVSENIRAQYKNKLASAKDKSFIESMIERDIRQKKTNALKSGETGALSRVIKTLLGVKEEYTLQEIQKPFIVIKWDVKIDYKDPRVKEIIQQGAIMAKLGIYGPPSAPQLAAPISYPISAELAGDPNIQDIQDPDAPEEQPLDDSAPFAGMNSKEVDFSSAEKDVQMDILRKMATQRGTTLKAFVDDPANKGKTRLDFYKLISAIPAQPDDDIPF